MKKQTREIRKKKKEEEDEAPLNWMGGFSNELKVDRRRFVA